MPPCMLAPQDWRHPRPWASLRELTQRRNRGAVNTISSRHRRVHGACMCACEVASWCLGIHALQTMYGKYMEIMMLLATYWGNEEHNCTKQTWMHHWCLRKTRANTPTPFSNTQQFNHHVSLALLAGGVCLRCTSPGSSVHELLQGRDCDVHPAGVRALSCVCAYVRVRVCVCGSLGFVLPMTSAKLVFTLHYFLVRGICCTCRHWLTHTHTCAQTHTHAHTHTGSDVSI